MDSFDTLGMVVAPRVHRGGQPLVYSLPSSWPSRVAGRFSHVARRPEMTPVEVLRLSRRQRRRHRVRTRRLRPLLLGVFAGIATPPCTSQGVSSTSARSAASSPRGLLRRRVERRREREEEGGERACRGCRAEGRSEDGHVAPHLGRSRLEPLGVRADARVHARKARIRAAVPKLVIPTCTGHRHRQRS